MPSSSPPHPGPGPTGRGPILLVDTYSLFFRAYHALPPMNTQRGEPTSALYGFCSVLLKELRDWQPRGLSFAVDAPQRTFRHASYAAYKAHREALPSALLAQLSRLDDLLAAFEVPVFRAPGFEADDVLATLSHTLRDAGSPALVMSGDRDLLQLVTGSVRVLFFGARGQKPVVYTEDSVRERFGVAPPQLPSWVALVGDPSDNLPGVPGVGPRTATRWVQKYESIEGLLARCAELEPQRLRAEIAARADQLRLNEKLATLRVDVPLPAAPSFGPFGAAAAERLPALFRELEFKSLVPRLDAVARALRS